MAPEPMGTDVAGIDISMPEESVLEMSQRRRQERLGETIGQDELLSDHTKELDAYQEQSLADIGSEGAARREEAGSDHRQMMAKRFDMGGKRVAAYEKDQNAKSAAASSYAADKLKQFGINPGRGAVTGNESWSEGPRAPTQMERFVKNKERGKQSENPVSQRDRFDSAPNRIATGPTSGSTNV